MLYAFSFVLVPIAVREIDAHVTEELERGSYEALNSRTAEQLWAAFGISDTYTYHYNDSPFASYSTLRAVFLRLSQYLQQLQDFDPNQPFKLCEKRLIVILALNATLAVADLCRRRAHVQP